MSGKAKKLIVIALIAIFFVIGVFAYPGRMAKADTPEQIQDHIKEYNKQLQDAQAELSSLQSQQYKNQARINTTKALISQLVANIEQLERELENLTAQAELNKSMLAEYMRQLYYADQENDPIIKLTLYQGGLGDLVMNYDGMIGIKSKIISSLQTIKDAKTEAEQVRDDLADQKQDSQQILQSQQVLQNQITGEVQEKQADVAKIQQKISKLRSTLSSFLGKSFSMDDVIDAVKFAEKKTGVRKEFLFAVLDKETDLGRYTGGCTYKQSKMGDTNLKYFKEINSELGYDYKKMKVSCALSYGIGGAMGVAQFMPSTWMKYKDKIAEKTGNEPADPWSLKDGIMGMALYLKDKGGDRKSGEHTAAAAYYCGSRLSRTVCQNYANTVISWSKGYDDYF